MIELISFLYTHIIEFVIFLSVVISIFFGWRSSRKKYRNTNEIDTRFTFAFRVLGISQLLTLCIVVTSFVLTYGYILFGANKIVYLNAVAAVIIFVFSLSAYSSARKWILKSSQMQFNNQNIIIHKSRSLYLYVPAGILIPIILFVTFDGKQELYRLLSRYILTTGNVELVKYMQYDKEYLYSMLAREKRDPSICDKILTPFRKSECIKYSTK